MKTISLSTNYHLKWQFKNSENYKITSCGKIINCKTNRIIKETINGGYTIGFWINGKFIPKNKVNSMVEKINEIYCPF